jgi:hypothetical protein
MSSIIEQAVVEMSKALPPVFAGKSLNKLTGNAIVWGTIQNARCREEIPHECFIGGGRKILVRRDLFLNWWKGTLRELPGVAA